MIQRHLLQYPSFHSVLQSCHQSNIIRCLLCVCLVGSLVLGVGTHFSKTLQILKQQIPYSPTEYPFYIFPKNISIGFVSDGANYSASVDFNFTKNIGESVGLMKNQTADNDFMSAAHHQHHGLNSSSIKSHSKKKVTMNMDDDRLFWWASTLSRSFNASRVERVPKIAFLFLTRGPLPLAPLWERFFKGHEGKYSIYVHGHPSYKEQVGNESVFYGRRIASKAVRWGTISLVVAELRLLANALLDLSNQRFVLLSESCIPLFPLHTIYDYLIHSTLSFVNVYDDPRSFGRGRYKQGMAPLITVQQWRKGSQWFEMDRRIASAIVSDSSYLLVFAKNPVMAPDEHYLPTYVNIHFSRFSANRSLTFVDWSRGGAHPKNFGSEDITWDLLWKWTHANWCTYNGHKRSICFLFARKMLPNTLDKLLVMAPKALGY